MSIDPSCGNADSIPSILGQPRTAYLPGNSYGVEVLSELADNDIMVDANRLLRIFWPSDVPRGNTPGVILGWRNSELDLFVVSVLQDVEAKLPEISLRLRIY